MGCGAVTMTTGKGRGECDTIGKGGYNNGSVHEILRN